jgi:hypothetical protein
MEEEDARGTTHPYRDRDRDRETDGETETHTGGKRERWGQT